MERRIKLTLDITFRTVTETTIQEGETIDDGFDYLFDGGLKQYIKDYDPALGFDAPKKIEVVTIENKIP